jgi:hypothetical protein
VFLGSYWLTSLKSRRVSQAMQIFSEWLTKESRSTARRWA